MSKVLSCWKCGNKIENIIFPMSRREECDACNADLHVCVMCKEYDGRGGCNEPRAEHVSDTEKANFCDYFSVSGKEFAQSQDHKAKQAKAKLAALFGDEPESDVAASNDNSELTPAQIAEQKLRDLLGD
ncbi:hypothetical protein [Aliiglaciecola lipolytica]|uniref:Uncharacterized protein n=1 Tax=Aliiglaciecola lipolytica E3 TaxID=1127673 RepID=K6XWQ0_9ALTE|nr:hypothetical protein [Aliiglaciecola lipolytica]GAC16096.1 hypothetical protein GLIP_3482 [Aliiglaciecola lipolytica E3]